MFASERGREREKRMMTGMMGGGVEGRAYRRGKHIKRPASRVVHPL